jgi:hypothetical protein
VFYGSFDWHSCVHGYWLLVHLARRFPDLAEVRLVRDVVDPHIVEAGVQAEVAYFTHPLHGTSERPYGWAWLLKLASELSLHTTVDGQRWAATLEPLADALAKRFVDYLWRLTYPLRAGTHGNTAFAMALAHDYAQVRGDASLDRVLRERALDWYGSDRSCNAWEPSGDDFLSPALVEVECMRRLLPGASFTTWLDGFLPRFSSSEPAALFEPVVVSDRTDPKICHLDGLNLTRAWCLRGLARTLPPQDPRRGHALAAADRHLTASLPHVAGDYVGEHWLATFAVLALSA